MLMKRKFAICVAIVLVLLAVAVPIYRKSILRTKESLLKQNLFTLRQVVDEYTSDKKKAPPALEDLVKDGYLRAIPIDPITGNDRTWRLIKSADHTGVFDIRSGSDLKSREGTVYSEW